MEYLIKNLLPQNLLNSEASLTVTTLSALIFSLIVIYVIAPRMKKLETDKKFYLSTIPWLVSAGGLSALYASGNTDILLNGFIFTGLTATLLTAIYTGKIIEEKKKIDKSYTVLFTGILASIIIISMLNFSNPEIFLQTGTHILSWFGPLTILFYLLNSDKIKLELLAPIITHFMDASSTVVSLSNKGVEKKFVASLFIETIGPYGIFALKAITIIPIVYIIDKETEKKKKLFYLYIITALGLTITVRNTLLTATGL